MAAPRFYPTTVPREVSPRSTASRLSGSEKLNTMIGSRLSRHIENAVESITASCRASASS